ncbi:MAG TPA: HD domain-containing phosphohydrolase [Ardenticatenaceae bacterium]|nr:HD domain-containing phosphohydrolase [Ardenticatenaceae bacterium]
MRAALHTLTPQPLVGILMSVLAGVALAGAWLGMEPSAAADGSATTVTALLLLVGMVIAYHFPIHIRVHTKVFMTGVPLFLAAVLLPPPLAALVALGGVLTGELIHRSQTGNYPSDIATGAGRRVIVVLLGGLIAGTPASNSLTHALALLGVALAMLVAELVTGALELAPMTGERPLRVIRTIVGDAGVATMVQNLLGILGALAAFKYIWALALLPLPTVIVYLAFKNAKEMRDSTRTLLESMADAVDLRDPYTGGHSRRVAALAQAILQELEIMGPEADLIVAAARVHDIGKIGVPDHVLKKPDRLTPEEWAVMNTHPTIGAELLARYPDFARGAGIVRHHHEHWNGRGYPDALAGLDIPFGARVIAVADSFDAMTSDRPYRRGMSPDEAARILRAGQAEQWDPAIVDACLHAIDSQLSRPVTPLLQLVSKPSDQARSLEAAV